MRSVVLACEHTHVQALAPIDGGLRGVAPLAHERGHEQEGHEGDDARAEGERCVPMEERKRRGPERQRER